MKLLRIFTFLLLICAPVLLRAQGNSNVRVDTIRQGSIICLDTSVTSFQVCMILPGGIAMEKCCQGYVFYHAAYMKSGSIIIVDKIASRNGAGTAVRLPARKYVVK
jgi:hypothetical protein